MIVHALVGDLESARRAVDAGATVVQLRVKASRRKRSSSVGEAFATSA